MLQLNQHEGTHKAGEMMSNDYIGFCGMIPAITKEERRWWTEVENLPTKWMDLEPEEGLEGLQQPNGLNLDYNDLEDLLWAFNVRKDKDGDLIIYNEDGAQMDLVGKIVHAFLKVFRPSERFSVSWGCWSDGCYPGAFGGGVLVADKDGWSAIPTEMMENLWPAEIELLRTTIKDRLAAKKG